VPTIARWLNGELKLEAEGQVGCLFLSRGTRRNALADRHWQALSEALERARAAGLRALVLAGAEGSFCAGADLEELAALRASPRELKAAARRVQEVERALEAGPLPVVAAIEGACFGGGVGLALCCDVRLATEKAQFGLAPARLGLCYSPHDWARLAASVGLATARRLLIGGETIGAEEALRIGLIDELLPPERLMPRALQIAERWCAMAPRALAAMRRSAAALVEALSLSAKPLWREFYAAFAGAEFQEGVQAFLDKREPIWPC
jgi:enoyl-CoA hydratase/carnithine racemase